MKLIEGRKLDVRIAEDIFGLDVELLPAYREPECGTIQLYEPWYQKDIMEGDSAPDKERLKAHSAEVWDEEKRCGLVPAYRAKHETEDHYWYELVPNYSTSLDDAWKIVLKLRADKRPGLIQKFIMKLESRGMRWLFSLSVAPAKTICEASLEALEVT